MTLPGDLTTVTVTGRFLDPAGAPLTGVITFTPSAEVTDATGMVVIPAVTRACPLSAQGTFTSPPLASTDNADLSPESWEYLVVVSLRGAPEFSFSCAIPHTPSPVDLSALIAA
jgi:hypothetical protein